MNDHEKPWEKLIDNFSIIDKCKWDLDKILFKTRTTHIHTQNNLINVFFLLNCLNHPRINEMERIQY